jgi:hypothetical protein
MTRARSGTCPLVPTSPHCGQMLHWILHNPEALVGLSRYVCRNELPHVINQKSKSVSHVVHLVFVVQNRPVRYPPPPQR